MFDTTAPIDTVPASLRTRELGAIDQVVLANTIGNSDAVRRFAAGLGPQRAVASALAREFYPFCFDFSLFLAAAISHIRDERARMLLVANLYEEHGDLDLSRIHPELFRAFVRALDLDPAALEIGAGTAGAEAAARVTRICRNGPAHRALAALYAIELLFGPACELFTRGLEHLGLPAAAIEFFTLHSGADVVHAEQLRTALVTACKTSSDRSEALAVASEVGRMFFELFDRIASSREEQLALAEAS